MSFNLNTNNKKIFLESIPENNFENKGVLNPAAIKKNGLIHFFYRAISKKDVSSIGYCQIKDEKIIYRSKTPVIFPEFDYEKQGVEDPRITFLDGTYYLLYTAFDGKNAVIAMATSQDLVNFQKHGPISPMISYDLAEDYFRNSVTNEKYTSFEQIYKRDKGRNVLLWEKDAFIFPKKINGQFALVHRVLPGIQICYFDDFKELTKDFWIEHFKNFKKYLLLDSQFNFENAYIGGGCPPIETKFGWLLIYHAVEETLEKGRVYHAAAALLDLKNPQKIISRLPFPLFSPQKDWEKHGIINNVVFPTGAIVDKNKLSIFYGAADQKIGLINLDLNELLSLLISFKK